MRRTAFARGAISEPQYREARQELERRLLDAFLDRVVHQRSVVLHPHLLENARAVRADGVVADLGDAREGLAVELTTRREDVGAELPGRRDCQLHYGERTAFGRRTASAAFRASSPSWPLGRYWVWNLGSVMSGLVELGGDANAMVLGLAPDAKVLLKGAADAARCAGLGALVVECWGKCPSLDLTASPRLSLAAEQSGVTLLMLRLEAERMADAISLVATEARLGNTPTQCHGSASSSTRRCDVAPRQVG